MSTLVNYYGLTESKNIANATGTPGTLLSENRVSNDKSPWVIRHNFSYIKSEAPNWEGEEAYGWDGRGSYALCIVTRPFSNTNKNGEIYPYYKELEQELSPWYFGYKVFDEG